MDIHQQAEPDFVDARSVVRRIWGSSDMILFIFGGAAAEFALNKAVDWLYFTGKLPADPLGRLFSTVAYARRIVFSSATEANAAIDTVRHIHSAVETARGASIPDWAYRDVLFMLIHYSIAAHELLERRLLPAEKDAVYDVFRRMGSRLGLEHLPATYESWQPMRELHLKADLVRSPFTTDLFMQYKKHLGKLRFGLLTEVQKLIAPAHVRKLLNMKGTAGLKHVLSLYKLLKRLKLDTVLKRFLLPAAYRDQILALDRKPAASERSHSGTGR